MDKDQMNKKEGEEMSAIAKQQGYKKISLSPKR